jgi:hypothetical protein
MAGVNVFGGIVKDNSKNWMKAAWETVDHNIGQFGKMLETDSARAWGAAGRHARAGAIPGAMYGAIGGGGLALADQAQTGDYRLGGIVGGAMRGAAMGAVGGAAYGMGRRLSGNPMAGAIPKPAMPASMAKAAQYEKDYANWRGSLPGPPVSAAPPVVRTQQGSGLGARIRARLSDPLGVGRMTDGISGGVGLDMLPFQNTSKAVRNNPHLSGTQAMFGRAPGQAQSIGGRSAPVNRTRAKVNTRNPHINPTAAMFGRY